MYFLQPAAPGLCLVPGSVPHRDLLGLGEAAGSCLLGRGLVWRPATPGNLMYLAWRGLDRATPEPCCPYLRGVFDPPWHAATFSRPRHGAYQLACSLAAAVCFLCQPRECSLSLCKFCGLLAFTIVPNRGPGTEEVLGKDSCELVYSARGPT